LTFATVFSSEPNGAARPGRELFITRLGLGAHGGANGLVPLLPASMCEPDKAIRIALGERHAEKCAMRKTLSGGFWTVSHGLIHIYSDDGAGEAFFFN